MIYFVCSRRFAGGGNITGVGTDAYTYLSENQLKTGPASAALSYDPMGGSIR